MNKEEKYLLGYNDALEDIQKVAGEEGLDIEELGDKGDEGGVETIIDAYNQGVATALEEAGIEKDADDILGAEDSDLSDQDEAFVRGYTEALSELGIEVEDEDVGVEKEAAATTLLKNRLLANAFGKEAGAARKTSKKAKQKLLGRLSGKAKSLGGKISKSRMSGLYGRIGGKSRYGKFILPATAVAGAASYPTLKAIRAGRGR
jgi:hypothetical protein